MSLARPFTIVGSATLASRVSGFVRDILIAAILGTSAIADVYVAAFLIPNLVRRMMSEGALNAAIVPRLARLEREGGVQAARGFSDDLVSLLSAVVIVAVIVAELAMPQIMSALAYGFRADEAKFADAVLFGRIAFPFVGFTLIVALMAALLNAVERYAIAALVPVMLNVLLIGVMIALLLFVPTTQREAGIVLVATVLVAGFVQLALLWWAAARVGFDVTPRLGDAFSGRIDPGAKAVLLLALPGMLIAGSGHVHMVLASQFASLEARGISWLYFADRLFQLPLGFVASAIGVVLLPRISRALNQGDANAISEAQSESLLFAALLILPATAGLFVLSEPIVAVLFQRAAFTATDAAATAANLRMLALALPAFVIVKVIVPSFLAREAFRVPVAAVLFALAVNAVTALTLMETGMRAAPAAGVVAGATANALILIVFARGLVALRRGTRRRLVGAAVATLGMAGAVYFFQTLLAPLLDPELSLAIKGPALAGLVLAGIAVFLVLARLLGALEPALEIVRSEAEASAGDER